MLRWWPSLPMDEIRSSHIATILSRNMLQPDLPDLLAMFPPGPLEDWEDVPVALGNAFHDLSGGRIRRGDDIFSISRPLPSCLTASAIAAGDLIPLSSWGSSLANLLTPKCWESLRVPAIRRVAGVCEACGRKPQSLDVHEIWQFILPEAHSRMSLAGLGTQRFLGLRPLCKACHRCYHIGNAQAQGRLIPTLGRLAALNRWGAPVVNAYAREVMIRWSLLSRFSWILDFSSLATPSPLVIRRSWKEMPGYPGLLTTTKNGVQSVTGLMGVPWILSAPVAPRPL